MEHEEQVVIEDEQNSLANAAHGTHALAGDRVESRFDRAQHEGAQQLNLLEALPDDVALQRLDVDDDVRELRQLVVRPLVLGLQPLDDLFARPMVIVVQVEDDGVERQPFVAADRTSTAHVLEAVEEAVETGPD